jgi:hypothetical protein
MVEMFDKYRSGEFSPTQSAAFEELTRRQLGKPTETRGIGAGSPFASTEPAEQLTPRQQAMKELAGEIGPIRSFLIGAGEGFTTIGRGVGLVEPAGEIEKEAMAALEAEHPIATTAGQVAGEAAPFLIPGTQAGRIAPLAGRMLAGGAVAAAEGGIIQAGRGEDALTGAGIGGAVGMGAEILFPVLGKLGGKVIRRVTGRAPRGAMLDAAGNPTAELQQALDAEGMTFADLTQDATEVITGQKPGAAAGQVATKARAAEAGVPLTRGEVTKDYPQLAKEQRLLESAEDTAAEPLRQFKLKQSEAIKESLRSNLGLDVGTEETGQLIQDALTGRKKLLRTQKNELYETAAENAKEIGGVPIFTDNIAEALPDTQKLKRLDRVSKGAVSDGVDTLSEYGIGESAAEGIEIVPLNIQNVEDLRQELNMIIRGDQSGAAAVAFKPVIDALDGELDELASVLKGKGFSDEVVGPLKAARKTVRQLKTEFSPQSIVGRIIDTKKDGITQITEASKIYSKLVGKASPVEETRRTIKSLLKAGDKGKQSVSAMQSSTILDLIDAGFGTESRKISGIKVFNPIAFKRRLDAIGPDKMKAIFSNEKGTLAKLQNIEKIAADLIPPSGAQPKGSASVILDLMNSLGLAAITSKIPIAGPLIVGSLRKVTQPVKTGLEVRRALAAEPDVASMRTLIDKQFPGIASALGIAAITETDMEQTR